MNQNKFQVWFFTSVAGIALYLVGAWATGVVAAQDRMQVKMAAQEVQLNEAKISTAVVDQRLKTIEEKIDHLTKLVESK